MGPDPVAQSVTKLEAIRLQSSAYGVAIALVAGVTRIPGNLLYYSDFTAIPVKQPYSGKGGRAPSTTNYTYTAAILMALCHGSISAIPRIWRGKKAYADGPVGAPQTLTASETYAVPGGGGSKVVANAAQFTAVDKVTYPAWVELHWDSGDSYWQDVVLAQGLDYTASNGTFTFPATSAAVGKTVTITYQYTVPATSVTALEQLGVTLFRGDLTQSAPSWVTSRHSADALGYPGLAFMSADGYDLGESASVDNHTFEVVGPGAYSLGPAIPDVDPSTFMLAVLQDARYGARFPVAMIGSPDLWSTYCRANNLLLSPALVAQTSAADVLAKMATITNTGLVWSDGRLKFIPYGDTQVTGNGATYTPNVTPPYALTNDVFLAGEGESPVQVHRKKQSECFNHIQIEFQNRANGYAIEVAEAKDAADIEANGLRSAPIFKAEWICDLTIARQVAQLILQRSLYVRATYTFRLPWNFALMEPMDLVALTEATQGLAGLAARIVTITESDDAYDVEAEQFALGVAHAPTYDTQIAAGFAHDYSVAPGMVDAPVFFEPPVERTVTGLEVYAAVKGSDPKWGGCRIWVSMDGTNYRQIGSISAPARYGKITGPISGGVLPVLTSGQLTSGSAGDATALNTLFWIGGATKEFAAFTTATLTGPGAYNLGGLVRGAFGTSAASAHSTNDPWVRVDDQIVKSGPLDLTMIGKALTFKFTSFNVYGAAEQSIVDVVPYTYTILGNMAAMLPSTPTGLTAVLEPYGVRLTCNKSPEPDVVGYEWRVGTSWAAATVVDKLGGTSYFFPMQTTGSVTVWVAAVDALGYVSTPASAVATATAPSVAALTSAIVGTDFVLTYTGTPGSFAIAGYEVRFGDVYASATVLGFFQVTRVARKVDWAGNRRWWVAAVDAKGNYGTAVSTDVGITVPGVPTAARSEVVDNNALLYWSPPATGTLPVDRYEVRKGASWAAGTVVGSNGNSTFATVFEQASAVYTYWVAAIDSAGNVGAAASIIATIAQPPDYVLRANWDSAFTGTLTNMFVDADGSLIGPVDTTQTWATHFSSRGWTAPSDQITAGYPIYINPSATSGSYDETFDYGSVLGATTVTAALGYTVDLGAVTATCQLYWKLNSGDGWTALGAGITSALLSNFRYVRVVWNFACTAGANILRVTSMNLKLAMKLKNDSGVGTITNATTGLAVTFGFAFVAADTPIVQPNGTTPLIPVVDYTAVPNPTGFTVYLYNLAGAKVTGSFSWSARGY